MKKLSVLFDHQTFTNQEFGGISKYFFELINILNEKNLVETNFSFKYHKNHYLQNLNHDQLCYIGKYNFRGKTRILKYYNKNVSRWNINKNEYDILHPTYYNNYFIKNLKKPYVITVYDMIHEKFPQYFKDSDKIIKEKKNAIINSTKIIAISNSTKNDLLDFYNIPKNKVEVVHLATNSVAPFSKETLKNKKPFFLFVGSRNGYKNFNFMVKAISRYLEKDYELFCIGGGTFKIEENNLFRKLNISDNVKWFSADENTLSMLYKSCEALIYPSLYEGFGLPILEAFASDCIVVSGSGGSLKEIGGDASIYFNYDDYKSLTEAVEKAIIVKKSDTEFVKRATRQLNNFSWSNTAINTFKIYESLL